MKVKVKDGMNGFYGGNYKNEGDIFNIEERKTIDGKNISCDQQFSDRWMEKVEVKVRKKPGPKPKPKTEPDKPLPSITE